MAARKRKFKEFEHFGSNVPSQTPSAPRETAPGPKYKDYSKFAQMDGRHPWQHAVPEGYVLYPVRKLQRGKILYFNFQLGKEMGLLAPVHPHRLTAELEATLIDTFSLQIINENDELKRRRFAPEQQKPHPFMATRYLQLQHPNKQGRTSGDGRSIWNGIVQHRGRTWDVSSRGTGVTRLSPGSVLTGKLLASGDSSVGYGCGTADLDELIGAALMSEVYHHQGVQTERTLAIIDLGNGVGIGVRAAPNLIRPAHLFMYLKQKNWSACKKAVDYLIDRQVHNQDWQIRRGKNRYWQMAKIMSQEFAWFAARLDVDYIFAWLDWDGDNVLCNAGIIDYGSIRQFGLRHDQYRYDDIERFSTNLNEQRKKARLIIQAITQMADFVIHGKRRPLMDFRHHAIVKEFDRHFIKARSYWRLYRMGFHPQQIQTALKLRAPWLNELLKDYAYLEAKKTHQPLQQVADGVHRPAILNLRQLLSDLPSAILQNSSLEAPALTVPEMFARMISAEANGRDLVLTRGLQKTLERFETNYRRLLRRLKLSLRGRGSVAELSQRAAQINRRDRMTGNGVEHVVQLLLQSYQAGYPQAELQTTIEYFIADQILNPDARQILRTTEPLGDERLFAQIRAVIEEFREDI